MNKFLTEDMNQPSRSNFNPTENLVSNVGSALLYDNTLPSSMLGVQLHALPRLTEICALYRLDSYLVLQLSVWQNSLKIRFCMNSKCLLLFLST